MITEPSPFDPKWFSHKFKGPGLTYEVGVCIENGHIVWVYGPFPCGRYADLTIFKMGLKLLLSQGEKVLADGGYRDELMLGRAAFRDEQKIVYARCRARHKTGNRRFTHLFCVGHRFRHDVSLHSAGFHAVCNIT